MSEPPQACDERYHALLESIELGFCTIEVVFDDHDVPVDYRFLEINRAFVQQTGLTDAVGRCVRELVPEHEAHWFERYGRVAKTGVTERFEDRADALGRFYEVTAFRIGEPEDHQVGVLFNDIAERLCSQAALSRNQQRFRLLSETNGLLLTSDDPERAIQIIGEKVMEYLQADVFFNYVLDPGADKLRLNAWGGVDERVAKMIERLELGQAICGCVAMESQRIISEDVQHNGDPRAELVRRMGVQCYACHPILVGDRAIGTLSFGTKRTPTYPDDDIEVMRTVTTQVSVAVQKSRLYSERTTQVRYAEALNVINSEVHSSRDFTQTMQRIVEEVVTVLEVEAAIIQLRRDGSWESLAVHGLPEPFSAVRIADEDAPLSMQAVETRQPVVVSDTSNDERVNAELMRTIGVSAFIAAPLIVRGDVTGIIFADRLDGRTGFLEPQIDFLKKVASTIALGLENARLFASEQRRRKRMEALHGVMEVAVAELDSAASAHQILEYLVSHHGFELANVWMASDAALELVASIGYPADYEERFSPMPLDAPYDAIKVFESGKPLVVADTDAPDANPAVREMYDAMGVALGAYVIVPLRSRGNTIGTLHFGWQTPRAVEGQDLDFYDSIAREIGAVLENARLYEAEHTIAERLREALLATPPSVRGVEFAHAYRAASEAARVGGDLYDIFSMSEDRVGIMIGDVAGKGIDAAVMTSMVKNTVRAHANERGKTPARILELTNNLVFESTSTEAFVTVFFGILDVVNGRLTYASAGHLTHLVRSTEPVETLEITGPLLGAFAHGSFTESETRLGVEDLLFLYTDGVTEARRDSEIFGESRLRALLAGTAGRTPAEVVSAVVNEVWEFGRERLRDDLAVLAVKRTGIA